MSYVHPSLRPDPAKQRAWKRRSKGLTRGKGLNAVGARKRRTRDAEAEFRREVHARYWCEGNAVTCSATWHPGVHAHHIWPSDRSIGFHDPRRGLLLCTIAHDHVHRHPEWSYRTGYLGRSA